jgi:hypothetical protein
MTQEIKPTHVTFEQYESYCDLKLLQLLYDKGFRFKIEKEGRRVINNLAEQRFNEGDVSYCNNYITYSVVVEWLRINHGIWVYPLPIDDDMKLWQCRVIKGEPFTNVKNTLKIITCGEISYRSLHSPQEAYSAAFDYIKDNNLI